ncbi:MAG TPA: hypothetical protein VMS77_04810 [Conexivisphaerales archaeon]|nr:hypothetical protein [Conexivisphaerales archaeon]
MVKFDSFVRRVIRELNRAGIEYALTGALAVSYYGRPRTTSDVDVIVKTTPEGFARVSGVLRRAKLRVKEGDLEKAWESKYRIASFEDPEGLRLDVMMTADPIPRRPVKVLGEEAYLQDPTWLLLSKLRLMKVTLDGDRRSLDRQDILSVLRNAEVDLQTLREESRKQLTFDVLEDLLTDAESP